jgi:hypothetical protein
VLHFVGFGGKKAHAEVETIYALMLNFVILCVAQLQMGGVSILR